MGALDRELHALRLAGDEGRDGREVGRGLSAGWPGANDLGALEALQLLHAPRDPGLRVHHPVGVGEEARQLRERAFELAGALAQVARLEARVEWTTLLLPEAFTLVDIQVARVAPGVVAQHLAIALDLFLRRILTGSDGPPERSQKGRAGECGDETSDHAFCLPGAHHAPLGDCPRGLVGSDIQE